MSDDFQKDETEVEAHRRILANDEATENDENGEDDEVEGHMRASGPRLDAPRTDGSRSV